MITINKEPTVSVGILTEEKVVFELYGDYKTSGIKQIFSGRFNAEVKEGRIICRKGDEKIEISDEIIFKPLDENTDSFVIKDVIIGVKFHWERKEKQRFQGSLKLKRIDNKILVINVISVEKYLVSVISSEMSSKSSIQLLKSHAIVSRSWILAQLEKRNSDGKQNDNYHTFFESDTEIIKWYDKKEHQLFDVCADDHCQRYHGVTKIFSNTALNAIEETKGIVLVYDDTICDTRYSKSCGGVSESYQNVWEPKNYEYLSSVVDYKYYPENYNLNFSDENIARKWIKGNPSGYCNTSDERILSQVLLDFDQETKDFYRWKVEYSQKELSGIIKTKSNIDFGEIIDLVPIERGDSSRLIKLKIIGTKKTLIIGKELEIRRILSQSHLYSSAIIIDKYDIQNNIPQKFIISGAGWGHGVGLCQIGAAVMASIGHQFDEILSHYFKDAKLKKIY
ncbi:MAG: SpoIID/LytB domain-containing protein [Ignavibacteriaceae bacterium]